MEFDGDRERRWEYDPDQLLGSPGSYGKVHPGLSDNGQPVAVKVVELGGGLVARLRHREAEIAQKLDAVDAQHLIEIHDTAEVAGKLLLVMDRAEMSLADAIEGQGAFSAEEVVTIMLHLARGLKELQQASIIHRDLKPGNVLLHAGSWKLADFGIARDAELGTQTVTFVGHGTFPYMAPETWLGRQQTAKTDFYALGCIGYQLITGTLPFPGPEEADFANQHLQFNPPDFETENRRLKRIILRLLLKDPAARHQDARAVEEALAAARSAGGSSELADLVLLHAEERSAEDARVSAAEVAELRRQETILQGSEDLKDVLEDATDRIRLDVPEVTLTLGSSAATISSDDAAVDIGVVPDFRSNVEGDPIVSYGEVHAKNRRGAQDVHLANIGYEAEGDRYVWVCYRFRAHAGLAARDYPFGPLDREHGIDRNQFADHRRAMLQSMTDVFMTTKAPLSAEEVVRLYGEALAMPAPPPG